MFSLYSIKCFLFILSNVSFSFYQLFLFSFHWIFLFSCRRRLCVLSFTAHFWSRAHILMRAPYRTFGCYLFLTLICTFCTLNPWFYCWGVDLFVVSGRWRERISFPSHLIRWITTICCIPVKGEGEKRKTADARMRVQRGVRGLFFMGKQIAPVRRVIYSTNWRSASITATRTLFLRGAMHTSLRGLSFVRCYKERKTTFWFGWVDDPVKRQRKLTSQIALRLVVYQAWGAYVVLVAWLYAFMSH